MQARASSQPPQDVCATPQPAGLQVTRCVSLHFAAFSTRRISRNRSRLLSRAQRIICPRPERRRSPQESGSRSGEAPLALCPQRCNHPCRPPGHRAGGPRHPNCPYRIHHRHHDCGAGPGRYRHRFNFCPHQRDTHPYGLDQNQNCTRRHHRHPARWRHHRHHQPSDVDRSCSTATSTCPRASASADGRRRTPWRADARLASHGHPSPITRRKGTDPKDMVRG